MISILENKAEVMKVTILALLIIPGLFLPARAIGSEGENMEKRHALSQRQQSIIPIAALTADGDIDRLEPALNQVTVALDM